MGLSIYYRLKAKIDADKARSLVGKLRVFAQSLPFDDVSPVFEHDPPDGQYAFTRADVDAESRRWKPGDAYLHRTRDDGKTETVRVPSLHVVCFAANLKGSETAMFGLASHPPVVVHREHVISYPPGGGEQRNINAGAAIGAITESRGWLASE